jgi:hypothetical protein
VQYEDVRAGGSLVRWVQTFSRFLSSWHPSSANTCGGLSVMLMKLVISLPWHGRSWHNMGK